MSKIITAQQLKDVNPAVSDTLGALVADAVNAWIENVTSRCWGDTKTVTERYDASDVVWLRHMDVQQVVAIKSGYPLQEQTTLEAGSYYSSPDGRLTLGSGFGNRWATRPVDYLEIQYTYGVAEENVPGDLILAAIGIATGYYEYVSSGGREVSRAQVGSYTVQYAASAGIGQGNSDAPVSRDMQVVNSYAMRRV